MRSALVAGPNSATVWRRVHYLVVSLGTPLVWLGWLRWPLPPTNGLDPSWQLVLGYAHAHHLRFGKEIIFTYGPWGFLDTTWCYPANFWPQIAWEICLKTFLAGTLAVLALSQNLARAILLLVASAFLLPLAPGVAPSLAIALLAWIVAARRQTTVLQLLSAAFFLGIIALQKFTSCMMVGVAGFAVTLVFSLERDFRRAAVFGAGLIGALIFWWLAAAQILADLPKFFAHSLAISSDYAETMFFDERSAIFWWGIATGTVAMISMILMQSRSRSSPPLTRLVVGLLSLAFGFLLWKQSFVRADGHVQSFFLCTLAYGLVTPRAKYGLPVAVTALIGFGVAAPELLADSPQLLRLHVAQSADALLRPAALHARFASDAEAATTITANGMREKIGAATVDILGHNQATALLNGFVYRPRPIFQSYLATSAILAQTNADFYASPRAPEFVLGGLQTIDGRFPPGDDARMLAIILRNYRPAHFANGQLLLERAATDQATGRQLLRTQRIRFGQRVAVPKNRPGSLVWVKIDMRRSRLGWLRTLFYKTAEVSLRINDGRDPRRYRLTLPSARGGFVLSPVLRDTGDLRDFIEKGDGHAARTMAVEIGPNSRRFFRHQIGVKFFSEKGPPSPLGEARMRSRNKYCSYLVGR